MPALKPVYETRAAACRYAQVRQGHGLEILVETNYKNYTLTYEGTAGLQKTVKKNTPEPIEGGFSEYQLRRRGYELKLDFHGQFYGAVGIPGAKNLAEWFLPLRISKFKITRGVLVFILGAKKLSHTTLDKTLLNIKRHNDPVIAMDVLLDPNAFGKEKEQILLVRVVTRASEMIKSLMLSKDGAQKITKPLFYNASISNKSEAVAKCISQMNMRRNPKFAGRGIFLSAWYHFQYLKYPVLFLLLLYYLILHGQANRDISFNGYVKIPRMIWYGAPNGGNMSITAPGVEKFLFPLPRTRSAAFKIGRILGELESLDRLSERNSTRYTNLLNAASSLVHRKNGTFKNIEDVARIATALDEEEDMLAFSIRRKVMSLFSVVNLIWLLAIIGMSISILPSIHYIVKPLRQLLERIARCLLENIIQPFFRRMHDWGVIELLVWAACSWLILDSHRFYGQVAGRYLAITAFCGSILAAVYTTSMHFVVLAKRYYGMTSSNDIKKQSIENIIWFLAAAWLAGALHFKSEFLGFAAIAAVYYKLGFGGYAGRMCYALGFDDKNALYRNLVASFTVLNAIVALRVFKFKETYSLLSPIQTPVSIFGSLVSNIGLLIISSLYYRYRDAVSYYAIRNALMVLNLLYSYYLGVLLGIDGLTSTSRVFFVLYLWTKFSEVHFENNWSPWLLIFGTSITLWRGSLYLHTNPSLLVDMIARAA